MLETIGSMSTFAVLTLGLIFGLKHATEVDHVVAVSTIVSQHRNVFRSAIVGGLWGIGHTAALLVIGALVLSLKVAIPERVSSWLEFAVALMIIGLGGNALLRALKDRRQVHRHEHNHDGVSHVHVHFHDQQTQHKPDRVHSHAVTGVGLKPVLIGTMHGLAGSGALTLLVLTQIKSAWVGFMYLAIFGVGSIFGMLIMSGLIGLPFAFSASKLTGVHHRLQTAAACFSIVFGLWYAYSTASAL